MNGNCKILATLSFFLSTTVNQEIILDVKFPDELTRMRRLFYFVILIFLVFVNKLFLKQYFFTGKL